MTALKDPKELKKLFPLIIAIIIVGHLIKIDLGGPGGLNNLILKMDKMKISSILNKPEGAEGSGWGGPPNNGGSGSDALIMGEATKSNVDLGNKKYAKILPKPAESSTEGASSTINIDQTKGNPGLESQMSEEHTGKLSVKLRELRKEILEKRGEKESKHVTLADAGYKFIRHHFTSEEIQMRDADHNSRGGTSISELFLRKIESREGSYIPPKK